VVARVRSGDLAAVGIDMPIGLAPDGRRAADAAARARLGPRRSSLFPTPPAAVLHATDYPDALARCRAASGVGMSKQAYNLLPKMREVAALVTPDLQPAISEVHPETTFVALGGTPCTHPKRTAAGVEERLGLLRADFPTVDELVAPRPSGVATDDVLDALAAAWTARRIALGTAEWLGDADARDDRGLRLTIAV
jgi:predicted RNase H-like nuclease